MCSTEQCTVNGGREKRGVWVALSTRLLQRRVPGVPGKLSLLSLLTTLVPPASVCVSFPRFLVMATCSVSSPPHHPSSPWSPSIHNDASFSASKAILQVEVGHLEACGLAVEWCAVSPPNQCSPQGLRPRGLLKLSVASIQHLLIEQDRRLATLGSPSSRQRLPCPLNTVTSS